MENHKVDKKTKILFVVFFILLAVSVFMTYKRTMIEKDFYVVGNEPVEE